MIKINPTLLQIKHEDGRTNTTRFTCSCYANHVKGA